MLRSRATRIVLLILLIAAIATIGFVLHRPVILVGAGIGLVTGVLGQVLGPRLNAQESWLWRHGHSVEATFFLATTPATVVDRFIEICGTRSTWYVESVERQMGNVEVRTSKTPWSLTRQIHLTVDPAGERCAVTVLTVAPQKFDWGEGRRVMRFIQRSLSTDVGTLPA